MGYHTRYRLFAYEDEDPMDIENIIKEVRFNKELHKKCGNMFDDELNDEGKTDDATLWYAKYHEPQMIQLSLAYPNVEFVLTGEGEDNLDVWRKYFKNGKLINSSSVRRIFYFEKRIDPNDDSTTILTDEIDENHIPDMS